MTPDSLDLVAADYIAMCNTPPPAMMTDDYMTKTHAAEVALRDRAVALGSTWKDMVARADQIRSAA